MTTISNYHHAKSQQVMLNNSMTSTGFQWSTKIHPVQKKTYIKIIDSYLYQINYIL